MYFVQRSCILIENQLGQPAPKTVRWSVAAVVALSAAVGCSSTGLAAEKVDLSAGESSAQQVRLVIEVQGELKTNPDGKEVQRVPVTVEAEQQYVERASDSAAEGQSAGRLRYYRQAKASIQLGKTELEQSLRDDRRHVVLQGGDDRPVLFSPLGPLSREELELLEVPGSLLPLVALLPEQEKAIGDTWELPEAVVAKLLCLDVIHQHDVVCKLVSVEKGVAIVTLNGKVSGAIEGVSSDCELIAKYNFDVQKKCLTWLALAVRENRAVGHAQPGFETVTKLRMVVGPTSMPAELSEKSIAGLPLVANLGEMLLGLKSDNGGYELMHDRRWRMMVDRHDVAIFRMVDRGDLVAQCNVSKLPQLPAGEQLSLEGLQADVKKTLGKNFGQVVEASQQVNEHGIRVLRVVAAGESSELPIQWTYYHLSDEHGHRASVVFTIESKLVERFAQIDAELISGFRFLDLPDAEEQTPAAKPAVESATKRKAAGTTKK